MLRTHPNPLTCTTPTSLNHCAIPLRHLRNTIFLQQRLKVRICASREIMRDVIVHIMHGNSRRIATRAGWFTRRTRITETLAVIWIDARCAGRSSPCGASTALCGELPVRAVRFIALGEEGECSAGVGLGRGVATAVHLRLASSFEVHSL
jgi:hypothetical protein